MPSSTGSGSSSTLPRSTDSGWGTSTSAALSRWDVTGSDSCTCPPSAPGTCTSGVELSRRGRLLGCRPSASLEAVRLDPVGTEFCSADWEDIIVASAVGVWVAVAASSFGGVEPEAASATGVCLRRGFGLGFGLEAAVTDTGGDVGVGVGAGESAGMGAGVGGASAGAGVCVGAGVAPGVLVDARGRYDSG